MSQSEPLSKRRLTEKDARSALNAWCAASVFRLPKLGDEADLTDFQELEYYFVSLSTLIEQRTLRVVEEPFRKGRLDEGNNKDVWSAPGSPPSGFENKKCQAILPHSDAVADCGHCRGKGESSCSKCRGSRKIKCTNFSCSFGKVNCSSCGGEGRKRCGSCFGSGYKTEYGPNGSRQVRCNSCSGGYNTCSCSGGKVQCSTCGGSSQVTCNGCRGRGQVTCTKCSGAGKLRSYKIADIVYKVVRLESNTPFGKYPVNLVKRAGRETVFDHAAESTTQVPDVNREVDSMIEALLASPAPGEKGGGEVLRQAILIQRLPACCAKMSVSGRSQLDLAVFGLDSLVYAPGCPTRLGVSTSKVFAGIAESFQSWWAAVKKRFGGTTESSDPSIGAIELGALDGPKGSLPTLDSPEVSPEKAIGHRTETNPKVGSKWGAAATVLIVIFLGAFAFVQWNSAAAKGNAENQGKNKEISGSGSQGQSSHKMVENILEGDLAQDTGSIVVFPDEGRFLTIGTLGESIWDARTLRCVTTIANHLNGAIGVSNDGRFVVGVTHSDANYYRGSVIVWDASTGAEVSRRKLPFRISSQDLLPMMPDGNSISFEGYDFQYLTGRVNSHGQRPSWHPSYLSLQSRTVLMYGRTDTPSATDSVVWSPLTGKIDHLNDFQALGLTSDGGHFFVIKCTAEHGFAKNAHGRAELEVRSTSSPLTTLYSIELPPRESGEGSVCVSGSTRAGLIVVANGGTLELRKLSDGQLIDSTTIDESGKGVYQLAMTSDGHMIITASQGKRRIYTVK